MSKPKKTQKSRFPHFLSKTQISHKFHSNTPKITKTEKSLKNDQKGVSKRHKAQPQEHNGKKGTHKTEPQEHNGDRDTPPPSFKIKKC